MNKKSKPDVVLRAVQQLKDSEFGATAIKVELEANLCREYADYWDSDNYCHNWLMEELERIGLAEKLEDGWLNLSHGVETQYHPIGALAYAEFYNDGSVDSEFTFTLRLNDPQNINLLPRILNIWNSFLAQVEEDTGNELELHGAGMHMALINTADCHYPSSFNASQLRRFDNFQRSMTLLLPALYFLGSSDNTSRAMEYREPRVTVYAGDRDWSERRQAKFSAIAYNQGALEFRVFQPCYNYPELILDNFVVMANCVRKYWKRTYQPSGIERITKHTRFGNDSSRQLERLYVSIEHVDMLNEGLKRLKPSYYTIKQLKQQRDFKLSKRTFNGALARIRRDALVQYKEYEARFEWGQKIDKYMYIRDILSSKVRDAGKVAELAKQEAEVMAEAERRAEELVERNKANKQSLDSFVKEKIAEYQDSQRAHWTLEVA